MKPVESLKDLLSPLDEKTIDGETLRCLFWGFEEFNVRTTLGRSPVDANPILHFGADRSRIISGLLTMWLIPRRRVLEFHEMLHYCHHFDPPRLPRVLKNLDKALAVNRKERPKSNIDEVIGIEACLQSKDFIWSLEHGKYTKEPVNLEKLRGLVELALIFSAQDPQPFLDMIAALENGNQAFDDVVLPDKMRQCLIRMKLLFYRPRMPLIEEPAGRSKQRISAPQVQSESRDQKLTTCARRGEGEDQTVKKKEIVRRQILALGEEEEKAIAEEVRRDIEEIGKGNVQDEKNLTESVPEVKK